MHPFHGIDNLLLAVAGWDPLGWIHDMDWYRDMLRADWFQPIRPYWLRYHLDWVALLVLLLILVLSLWMIQRFLRRGLQRRALRSDDKTPLKMAAKFEQGQEWKLAADSYREAGELEKAYELYRKVDCLHEAAEVAEKLGKTGEAVELYDRCNNEIGALRVLRESGDLERAVDYHRKRGTLDEAAQMFLDASQPKKAAELFIESGNYIKAATILFDAGENLVAADYLLAYLGRSSSEFTENEAELMEKGSQAFGESGRHADSARLLKAAKQYPAAAERYLQAGDKVNAAECFELAEDLERAAVLFREVDRKEDWIRLLEVLRRSGKKMDKEEWAKALEEAGQHERAARQFQELGKTEAAVQASLKAEQPAHAAALLAETGKHGEAAKRFLDAGDPSAAREQALIAKDVKTAAIAAMQARMFYEAGCDFFKMGDMARTVDALQQVTESHPEYRTASSLLGQAFSQLKDREMAIRMHRRATLDLVVARDNLDLFYPLARLLEESGNRSGTAEAESIYRDILAVQYTYRDAKKRHEKLRGRASAPETFGKYQVIERIGKGGMGELYLAKTTGEVGFERMVAIKRVLPELSRDEKFVSMLLQEAKLTVQLNHANIAQVFDLGKIEGTYFISMEYVAGKNMRLVWKAHKQKGLLLPIPFSAYVMSRVSEALDYAHRKTDTLGTSLGIIHRDMSPQNILVSYEGAVKVIDFGIAKASTSNSLTKDGVLKGKLGYMSPEQVRGLPIDQRSDVYSAGIVLYELLTGEFLFMEDSDVSTIEKVRNAHIPLPSALNKTIPPVLEQVVMKALSRDPDDRFQYCVEMQRELDAFLAAHVNPFGQLELANYMKKFFQEDYRIDMDRLERQQVTKPIVAGEETTKIRTRS